MGCVNSYSEKECVVFYLRHKICYNWYILTKTHLPTTSLWSVYSKSRNKKETVFYYLVLWSPKKVRSITCLMLLRLNSRPNGFPATASRSVAYPSLF
ncbi:hypothetical protein QVD17_30663 [Tagetes erecta]|uniref:Uncharacterized protein n=1 Tax=Tagetes erecta TaxID=13708 RepID=A0AAD8NNI5_TARER|nr:hypothetical protein QVD17_30663 [Tagetes erecta]